jgi:hypothetical protein
MPENRVLVLRTCKREPDGRLTAHGGFVWPESGLVASPDWNPEPICGYGLHGLLWGEGDGNLLNWDDTAAWLVVAVDASSIVDLGGKVKFPRGEVVCRGDRKAATDYILAHGAAGKAVMGCYLTGGNRSTLTGGDYSTLTGGNRLTLTGGDDSTLTGGDYSTLTGGYGSTLTGGDGSTLTGGNRSTLTFSFWNGNRKRLVVGYVGEDGIEPGRAYRLDHSGKIVEALP